MTVSIKTKPALVVAGRSHWLEPGSFAGDAGPFKKEEFHPILELEAPRVGTVRAEFSADRYKGSDSGWGNPMDPEGWRIILRDVRTVPAEGETFGSHAAGIGDATRAAIRDACEPVIREWIGSDEYHESRRRAAVSAILRTVDVPNEYRLKDARRLAELAREADDIDVSVASRIGDAIEGLAAAIAELEAVKGS